MKKTTIALFGLGVLTLTSCKKDRTCDCTVTVLTVTTTSSGTTSNTNTWTESRTLKMVSNDDAMDVCGKTTVEDTNSASYSTNSTTKTTTNDCKLK